MISNYAKKNKNMKATMYTLSHVLLLRLKCHKIKLLTKNYPFPVICQAISKSMDTCISLKKVGESQNVKCMKLLFDFSCKSPVALKHMEYK